MQARTPRRRRLPGEPADRSPSHARRAPAAGAPRRGRDRGADRGGTRRYGRCAKIPSRARGTDLSAPSAATSFRCARTSGPRKGAEQLAGRPFSSVEQVARGGSCTDRRRPGGAASESDRGRRATGSGVRSTFLTLPDGDHARLLQTGRSWSRASSTSPRLCFPSCPASRSSRRKGLVPVSVATTHVPSDVASSRQRAM